MEELEEKYREKYFKESDLFELATITNINHKPHPYTIGPRHITHASDHHGGMLGDATMEAVPCAVPGCVLSYAEHTSDKVMFLKLKRYSGHKEASDFITALKEDMVSDKIDGIAFVETEEKYRIDEVSTE